MLVIFGKGERKFLLPEERGFLLSFLGEKGGPPHEEVVVTLVCANLGKGGPRPASYKVTKGCTIV